MEKNKFIPYLIYFVIFSFVGFLIEYIFSQINGQAIFYGGGLFAFFNLKLPLSPIYGIGGVLLIYLESKIHKKRKFVLRGLINGLILIGLELISGLFFLLINEQLWSYSSHTSNLLGIISLEASLWWIAIGYLFTFLYDLLNKSVHKI